MAATRRQTAERALRALWDDPFDDVVLTPAARVYLAAFDRLLGARAVGDTGHVRVAETVKDEMLARMLPGPIRK